MGGRARVLLAVGVVVLLASCGGTSRADFDAEIQSRGGGLGSSLPLEALAALEDEVGEDLRLRSMTIGPARVTVEVLVPGTGDELDAYAYGTSGLYGGGGLSGPTPVSGVPQGEALDTTLFRPGRVAFEELDDLVDQALAQADLAGGYAQSVRINRTGNQPTITVHVDGTRNDAQISFTGDGRPRGEGSG